MVKLYIDFKNFKNPFIKNKIRKLFFQAIKDKFSDNNLYFQASIRYASKAEIRSLNKRFRSVDKSTDVLSFPLIDFNEESLMEVNLLGDIIICKEVAKEQAKKLRHSFTREVCFLALHGFLHLLGYNHIDKDDEKQMTAKAEEILEKYKVKR